MPNESKTPRTDAEVVDAGWIIASHSDGQFVRLKDYNDLRSQLTDCQKANVRLTDLVRYQRAELHQTGLISDDEYAALCAVPDSPARLEGYDKLKSELDEALEVVRDCIEEVKKQVRAQTPTGFTGNMMSEFTSNIIDQLNSLKRADQLLAKFKKV